MSGAIPESLHGLNFYEIDPAFAARQSRLLGDGYAHAEPLLRAMGAAAGGPVDRLASIADAHPPQLVPREGFDEVELNLAYHEMRRIAYGAGIVSLAYEPDAWPAGGAKGAGRAPHVLVFGLGYVFGQAEAGLFCPICMTDGAARVVQRHAPERLRSVYLPRLTARDTRTLSEGAMFLTERQGGSDVGANATVARPASGREGVYTLHGEKWFCSNAGAEVMLVLARPEGAPAGTAGLGLFLMPLYLEDGRRNPGLRFRRLKDKLGTRSMATGEAELDGAEAYLLAAPAAAGGAGFKAMLDMVALSRLYNAVASCACMRRALAEAALHARRRVAFGQPIERYSLVRETLVELACELEGATALTFEAARLLDRMDAGEATAEERGAFRALLPLAKLHTARLSVWAASEAIEIRGGDGYVETDSVLPRLLRDAQVLPIWEGTTNIQVLDVLRGGGRDGALAAVRAQSEARRGRARTEAARALHDRIAGPLDAALETLGRAAREGEPPRDGQAVARRLAWAVEASLLAEEADEALSREDGRLLAVAETLFALRLTPPGADGARPLGEAARAEPVFEAIVRGRPLKAAGPPRGSCPTPNRT